MPFGVEEFSCTHSELNHTPQSNDESSQTEKTGILLSEYSCDVCRTQHRRCDRLLPACSNCERKGISCYYTDIQKKKNRPSGIAYRYKPYLFGSESFSKQGIIDYYFDIITGGYPLISRVEIEAFVLIFDESPKSIDNHVEQAALFFSMKTICEHQKGYAEQAAKSVEKARIVLSRVFDHYNSFIVGSVYAHLLLYEFWLGNNEKCKLYLEILYFFRGKLFNVDSETLQPEQKNLQLWIEYFEKMIFVNGGLEKMTIERILRSLSTSNDLLGQKLPNEWNILLQNQITQSNYLKIWTIVEAIFTDSNEMEKIHESDTSASSTIEMTNLINRFLLHGMKIYIFSKSDDKELTAEMIERSANTITHITESPWFPLFPIETILFLKYDVGVHLQIVKMLCQSSNTNFIRKKMNYHELLKKDIRAYNLMKTKYPALINPCDIFTEAEKLLREMEHLTILRD